MHTYTITLLDKRVNVKLEYIVNAPSPTDAEKAALKQANADAGTPAWLCTFELIRTEVH